jgi:hypothetical protein
VDRDFIFQDAEVATIAGIVATSASWPACACFFSALRTARLTAQSFKPEAFEMILML